MPQAGHGPGLSLRKSTRSWVTQPPEPGSIARLKLPGSSTDSKARLNCSNWITSAPGLGAKSAGGLREERGGRRGHPEPRGEQPRRGGRGENGEGLRLLLSTTGRGGDVLCPAGPAEPGACPAAVCSPGHFLPAIKLLGTETNTWGGGELNCTAKTWPRTRTDRGVAQNTPLVPLKET